MLSCVLGSLHCSQLWLWSHYPLLYCSEPQSYYTTQLLFWLWFSFTLVQISIQQQHCHKYVLQLYTVIKKQYWNFEKLFVTETKFVKCFRSSWKVYKYSVKLSYLYLDVIMTIMWQFDEGHFLVINFHTYYINGYQIISCFQSVN